MHTHGMNRAIAFLLAASMLAVPLCMPCASSAGAPHALIGVIFDQGTYRVRGATVYLNNTRTGESLSYLTDELGRYSVDIDGYPSGYMDGDIIRIEAVYYQFSANGTVTVTQEPFQQLDLHLDYRMHIIDGYMFYPNLSPVNHFPVNVTNVDTDEMVRCVTDITGYYWMDIGMYPSGYTVNDDISAVVYFSGFSGFNHTVATSAMSDRMNITLVDIEMPVLQQYEPISSVSVGDGFRILAWVTDNMGVDGVRLYMKKEGGTAFTRYDLIQDDGALNDWNGDGMRTIWLYGQSTARSLTVQTALGDLLYYLETKDTSFTVTLPASEPQAEPFRIDVLDPIVPTLTTAPVSVIESGVPKAFTAKASDNVAISEVKLFYRNQDETAFTELAMLPDGFLNEYKAIMPAQMYLGTLEYYMACNDTSGNSARAPPSGAYSADVLDTTPPMIMAPIINSANALDPINITCTASDAWLAEVRLNFTDVDGVLQNVSMDSAGAGWFYFTIYGQNVTGSVNYTIRANDTSHNAASVSRSFPIYDAGTPQIAHQPPQFIEYNETAELQALVEDDVNVSWVNLSYLPPGGSVYEHVNTSFVAQAGMRNCTFTIPAQSATGALRYFINASDGTNVITWPALGPAYEVDVRDTRVPALSPPTFLQVAPSGLPAEVKVNVTENLGVSDVRLIYVNASNPDPLQGATVDMDPDAVGQTGTGTYSCEVPSHDPGEVRFIIFAADVSGNNATLPAQDPWLSPFTMTFADMGLPEIALTLPETVQVNHTGTGFINVTDETAVDVWAYCRNDPSAAFAALDLSLADGTYLFSIPVQTESCTLEIFAEASDGQNLNGTATYQVDVWNAPPSISHIGVASAPVGENVAFVAQVADDVHVGSVVLSWREVGTGAYTDAAMTPDSSGLYKAEMTFTEAAVIQYHITATDGELAGSIWPSAGTDHEVNITDLQAPVISHTPPSLLNTSYRPIFTATVNDNVRVAAVQLHFMNGTSATFFTVPMSRVSGTDEYTAILGLQPEGNLTYYITATDGINAARSPSEGNFTVIVEDTSTGGWTGALLLVLTIALIILAVIIILIFYRRKHNK